MGDNSISAIIVAGGSGKRMGGSTPKQFLELSGRPILVHTIERFHAFLPEAEIIVIIHPDETARWDEICRKYRVAVPHKIVRGGEERFHSVKNGLAVVRQECKTVLIQDAVRPLISRALIERVLTAVGSFNAVIPAVKAINSLRKIDPQSGKSHIVDRNHYVAIQTPQAFNINVIKSAYQVEWSPRFTDDASVVEEFGTEIHLIEGEPSNLKITTPSDLLFAEILLKKETQEGLNAVHASHSETV